MSETSGMSRRIQTIYAWITASPDGGEETIAAVLCDRAVKPLIGADRAGVESLRSLAAHVAETSGRTVRLKMFAAGVTIDSVG